MQMKKALRMTSIYIKRELLSIRFALCVIINVLFMFFFVFMDYVANFSDLGLHYFLQGVENSGAEYLLLMVAIFPASLSFCEDWDTKAIRNIISRGNRNAYTVSVVLSAALVSGLCLLLSYFIFSIIILIKYPLVPESISETAIGFPNWELLLSGREIECYLLYFLTKSSLASFYAALSVVQSVIITNKSLCTISPVFMYIIISKIIGGLGLPSFLDPLVIFNNNMKLYLDFGGTIEEKAFSPLTAFYPILYSCVFISMVCICTSALLKHKIENKL